MRFKKMGFAARWFGIFAPFRKLDETDDGAVTFSSLIGGNDIGEWSRCDSPNDDEDVNGSDPPWIICEPDFIENDDSDADADDTLDVLEMENGYLASLARDRSMSTP